MPRYQENPKKNQINLTLSADEKAELGVAAVWTGNKATGFATALYRHAFRRYRRIKSIEALLAEPLPESSAILETPFQVSPEEREQLHGMLDRILQKRDPEIIRALSAYITRLAGEPFEPEPAEPGHPPSIPGGSARGFTPQQEASIHAPRKSLSPVKGRRPRNPGHNP